STPAAAPLTTAWLETYSGCAGVASSGAQAVSGAVAPLPSDAARRMAVTGRQKTYVNLASQAARLASAILILSSAKRRAFSESVVCRSAATDRAIRFQCAPA